MIFTYLFYFLSLLTGCPEKSAASYLQERQWEGITTILVDQEGKERGGESKAGKEKPVEQASFFWKPGLIERVWMQYQALHIFQDKLLKGDAKPEYIFESLNLALVKDSFALLCGILWCFALAVCLLSFSLPFAFIQALKKIILACSFLFVLLQTQLAFTNSFRGASFSFLTLEPLRFISGLLLLLLSLIVFAWTFLQKVFQKQKSQSRADDVFVRLLKSKKTKQLWAAPKSLIDLLWNFALICLISIVLANALLLPLYILQLSFPEAFSLCLAAALLLFVCYYAYAYWDKARRYHGPSSFVVGLAFLCYRLLSSAFVSALALIALSLLIVVLLSLSFFNTKLFVF